VTHKINPILLERVLNKINNVRLSIILKLEDKLHAAILTGEMLNKSHLIQELKCNPLFSLVTTISVWLKFPVTLSGKTDKISIFESINHNRVPLIKVLNVEEVRGDTLITKKVGMFEK
jgi:hypothetical protein